MGGDLRRLSIALEIVDKPAVVVLDNPAADLDPAYAAHLHRCLQRLADERHAVICALSKPSVQVMSQIDAVTIVCQGRTIYCGPVSKVESYFCSSALGYTFRKDETNIADFLIDIANGVERPTTRRTAMEPEELQLAFEESEMFTKPTATGGSIVSVPADGVKLWGYGELPNIRRSIYRSTVLLNRAVYVKFRETHVIKKSLMASVVVACLTGYLLCGQGDGFGYYTMTMFNLPIAKVTNLTASFFFVSAFSFLFQVINVHIVCQKMQVFRYEQRAKCSLPGAFAAAMLLSEIPTKWIDLRYVCHIVTTSRKLKWVTAEHNHHEQTAQENIAH